jgi:hypothetical protein
MITDLYLPAIKIMHNPEKKHKGPTQGHSIQSHPVALIIHALKKTNERKENRRKKSWLKRDPRCVDTAVVSRCVVDERIENDRKA